MKEKLKIQFIGATREVTGSKFLLTTPLGKRILLDCGMFQGKGMQTDAANRDLSFGPQKIDHIILTHAHIDHSGLIPYMYRMGFRGSVVCTLPTRDLCAIMLADSGHIQESDVKWFNKRRVAKGLPPVEPIYKEDDARACMELFIGVAYNRTFRIDGHTTVRFTNTGHMLGSGVALLEFNFDGEPLRLAYTGDIGRPGNRILKSPEPFPQCDYLITESTYGNRLHPHMQDAEHELLRVVRETCVEKGGKLIIPSFAIGRTQEIVFTLNNFFNQGLLPKVNIYVDSPLAVNATDIFRIHSDSLSREVANVMQNDPDPFGFNSLYYLKTPDESKRLNSYDKPCVIISASGMLEAGRVKHHVANAIENPNNTILFVGYCSPITLGARIQSGQSPVSIFGQEHPVNATIEKIEAFSGHGDYEEMSNYLDCQDKGRIRKVFIVHGEPESAEHYSKVLADKGFHDIVIPEPKQVVELL